MLRKLNFPSQVLLVANSLLLFWCWTDEDLQGPTFLFLPHIWEHVRNSGCSLIETYKPQTVSRDPHPSITVNAKPVPLFAFSDHVFVLFYFESLWEPIIHRNTHYVSVMANFISHLDWTCRFLDTWSDKLLSARLFLNEINT